MSATLTVTGTWTPLNVDLTKMAKVDANNNPYPNVMHADRMQLEQLKAADLPELTQFIQAMSDGYGISFNTAKALLDIIWHAAMNRESPSVSRVFAA